MPNKPFNPITSLRPYEFTVPAVTDMYDHLPYQCDCDMCNKDSIAMVSGNLIKFYRCSTTKEYTIDNTNR